MNEHVTIDGEVREDRDARLAFIRAMVEAQKLIPLVPKTAKADRYHYANLASVVSAVQPALNAAGIFLSWRARRVGEHHLEVTCTLMHADGWVEEVAQVGPIPQGRNGLQDLGSAQTYLQRYTLALATGVATVEDTDGVGSQPDQQPSGPNPQRIAPHLQRVATADDLDTLREAYGRAKRDLRGADFDAVAKAIGARKEKLTEAADASD